MAESVGKGRPKGPEKNKVTISLDPDLIEWGKKRYEGLSGFINAFMRREKDKEARKESALR